MINPLSVATDGLLSSPTPLSIGARGLINLARAPVEEYVDPNVYGGGGKAYVHRYEWDDIIGDIERRQRIEEEDEEVLEIVLQLLVSGVLE